MRRILQAAALLSILTLGSCASTSELVRRSEEGLDAGDMDRAYKWSSRALDHEPGNPRAQQIMTTAATAIIEKRKAQIIDLAAADTLAAARAVLELDDFHADVARYRVTLPADPDFYQQQAAIRGAAARVYYDKGAHSSRPTTRSAALAELTEAKRFTPSDGDVLALYQRASEEAISPLAILPFNDDASSPALAQQVSDEVFRPAPVPARRQALPFHASDWAGPGEPAPHRGQAGDLSREDAVSLGRALGAERNRVRPHPRLEPDTHTDTYRETIFKESNCAGRRREARRALRRAGLRGRLAHGARSRCASTSR
jgi:hypothetical protein